MSDANETMHKKYEKARNLAGYLAVAFFVLSCYSTIPALAIDMDLQYRAAFCSPGILFLLSLAAYGWNQMALGQMDRGELNFTYGG